MPYNEDGGVWRGESHGEWSTCLRGPEYPVWIADFAHAPGCPSHVFVMIDARDGENFLYYCYPRKVATLYLPFLVMPRVETPEPEEPSYPGPTARPRSLTPEPMPTVLGSCPTRTPAPTEEDEEP